MDPHYKVSARIAKPVVEVFDAIVDPDKLSGYFTTIGGASGPLVTGTTVRWWDLVDMNVVEVVPNRLIHLQWPPNGTHPEPVDIRMEFDVLDDGATLVTISESGYPDGAAALKTTYSTCSGWTHMLACLKAWIEYGINLREGNFIEEVEGRVSFEENHDYLARVRGARSPD